MPKTQPTEKKREKASWDKLKEKSSEFANQVKEKSVEVAHSLEKNPATKNFWQYIKSHRQEAILGTFMLIGLVFSFYWLGGFIVGLASGLYAPIGLKGMLGKGSEFRRNQGNFATFVILVALVFMIFHAFYFIIGLLVGLGLKSIIINEFSRGESSKKQRTERTQKRVQK